ncbi:flagellar biosynthetic protein FliO [Undibacterium sp. Di26W]|uniref:flagellar biosynthetic protein FliO n=1 Tax=Undibacterium sp. Di26W TaxID=3413035 RepID=UPI003BF34AFD
MFRYLVQAWYLRCFFAFGIFFEAGTAMAQTSVAAPHTAIPFKQDKQSNDTMAYQSIAALFLASCAAYGIVLGLKRYRDKIGGGGIKSSRRLRTVEAIRLGKTSMLYVVEYNGEELLIAESTHGLQLLNSSPVKPQDESVASDV